MRYSRQHKDETHNRLLKKAAEEFRRNGVQGTGIAPLMGKLGLTHGGFYAHFDSKNELIAQATGPMFEDDLAGRMFAAAEAAPKGKAVRAVVDHYLSPQHRDSPEGCPLAGLAGEMARQPKPVRNAYIGAMDDRLKRIAALLPDDDEKVRLDQARLLMAGMAGTMMIARAMTDRDVSDHFLEQARAFYAAAFEAAPQRKAAKV
ncbi:MAG: TetR/AcrR family transcriptional regulator [Bradyrhizobium sp.]|nr:TetR/AcrR family transcriptional regulator [Bradyrhizobium sp.]